MTEKQLQLDLKIIAEKETDEVGLGVLSNGTPFLTGRGLARLCGVSPSNITAIVDDWQSETPKKRTNSIRDNIRRNHKDDTQAFIAVTKNGVVQHAFPEHVCMAVLEYYTFDATSKNEHANKAYRTLARKGFHDFVYEQVGLPKGASTTDLATRQFLDRAVHFKNVVPTGYFCIFNEITEIFAHLALEGVSIDSGFVPDISVGKCWAKYWKDNNLQNIHGMTSTFSGQFPDYYPQSAAGPVDIKCYPEDAIPEFRKWMRDQYFKDKFPNYLSGKVKNKVLAPAVATKILEAHNPPAITAK